MYSKLVDHVRISPNCTKPRRSKIDAIVIHHVAGTGSVEAVGAQFAQPDGVSANYGVGTDGRIACYVEEENRAYTSSNAGIDHRAITIEVSNCGGAPNWPVSDQALEATIALCADVCKRHGFKLNYTGDKTGNLHMHKWYANTACPGPYLASKFPYIAQEVNKRLGKVTEERTEENASQTKPRPAEQGASLKLPLLKRGSRGESVKALQLLLIGRGFSCGSYGADGDFGGATDSAVRAFQKAKKLAVDGVVGAATWGVLLGVSP